MIVVLVMVVIVVMVVVVMVVMVVVDKYIKSYLLQFKNNVSKQHSQETRKRKKLTYN